MTTVATNIEAVLEAMEAADLGSRAEFVGGAFTLNRPDGLHFLTQDQLAKELEPLVPTGYYVGRELRVHDGDDWIVPDLLVVPRSLLASGVKVVPVDQIVLMVEVLSPSTKNVDLGAKREFCERNGLDYWVVTPGDPWGHITTFGFGQALIPVPNRPGT